MKKVIAFYKKHNNFIFFTLLAIILFVPQIRMPVQVFLNRVFSFSPSEISQEKREIIKDWDWTLYDENQRIIKFSNFKGKVILINFWATWCPPCIAEFPDLQSLYDSYNSKVVFLFVAQDQPKKVENFMKKKGYSMPIYYSKSAPPELLNASALPSTYLISPSGEIVMQKTGSANWNSKKVHVTIDALLR